MYSKMWRWALPFKLMQFYVISVDRSSLRSRCLMPICEIYSIFASYLMHVAQQLCKNHTLSEKRYKLLQAPLPSTKSIHTRTASWLFTGHRVVSLSGWLYKHYDIKMMLTWRNKIHQWIWRMHCRCLCETLRTFSMLLDQNTNSICVTVL